jgi:small redox-active disulfide protein 2
MHVKILGPGCKNCQNLEIRARDALRDLGVTAAIDKVTDDGEIAGYGVMRTPGLVIDDEVVVSGRVPSARELHDLLAARTGTSSG